MKIKKWFFTHHIHYQSVTIFETDQYSSDQGYASEKEAILAAIKNVDLVIKEKSVIMNTSAIEQAKLVDTQLELIKRLG